MGEQTISLRVTAALLAAVSAGTYTVASLGDDVRARLVAYHAACDASGCPGTAIYELRVDDDDLNRVLGPRLVRQESVAPWADLASVLSLPGGGGAPPAGVHVECDDVGRCVVSTADAQRRRTLQSLTDAHVVAAAIAGRWPEHGHPIDQTVKDLLPEAEEPDSAEASAEQPR